MDKYKDNPEAAAKFLVTVNKNNYPRNRPAAAPNNRPAGKSSFFAKKTLHCPENRGKMKLVGAKRPETASKPLSARQPRRSDSRAEWRGSGNRQDA